MIQTRSAFAATGKTFRTKNISKRVGRIVISPIKEMSLLADEFQEKTGARIISFGQGIPYFDTPPHIKDAVRKALNEKDTARYTLEPGIPELRALIAKFLERDKGIANVEAKKEVVVTTGCQEAIACALASTIDQGDEVILFSPTYASHIEQTLQWGGIPQFFPLAETEGWRLDLKECEKRITKKTKVILFSNPSNPTGSVLSKREIEDLAKLAKKHDLVIIADETYDFLVYEGRKHVSCGSLKEIRDRVILCGSFSKRYALTGYRVGYAFASQGILDQMLKVHDALTICAPAISQKAAIRALKGSQEVVKKFVKKLSRNRTLMCQKLDQMKNFFEYRKPMGAYYILAKYKIPKTNSFELALKILYEARVIVIPGAAFGPTGEGHVRFSFACSPQEIEEGFRRLMAWSQTLPK